MEVPKSLKDAKIWGGIGGILILLSAVPRVGFIFYLSGTTLSFLAIKKISDLSKRKEIFRDYLLSFILLVIGMMIATAVLGISGFKLLKAREKIEKIYEQAFGKVLLAILIGWILAIIGAYFYRRSLKCITEVTKVTLFKTGGTLSLIGTILYIILIGVFIDFVARILITVAFFSLPDELPKLEA